MREAPGRVLMTADAVGGVWTYALELARGLARGGKQVLLCVMGGQASAGKRAQAAAIDGVEVAAHGGRLEWMREPWQDLRAAGEWLLEQSARFGAEIAHVNGYAHAALDWRIPVVAVAHSCVYSWFEAVRGTAPGAEWRRYYGAARRGLAAADLVIAPSRSMLNAIGRHYGEPRRSAVIFNGRSADRFAPGQKENFILTAGRLWDEAKNIQVLDACTPDLKCPVIAAGSVRGPDGVVARFSHLQLPGALEEAELAGFYARAPIFALPALYEPFGYTAVEAALSGCALVLSDLDSLREVWGDAAVYVPARDPEWWSTELNRLAADARERAELARRAYRRAAELTSEAMTEKYIAAYAEAAQRQRTCESFFSAIRCDRTGTMEMPTSSAA